MGLRFECLNAAAGYKANTGVIVVRRADTTIASTSITANFFNIQVSGCPGDAARYVLNTDSAGPYTLHANGLPGCYPSRRHR